MISEILDGVIVLLLVTGLIYGFRLNRRISVIHDSRKELASMFKAFDQTILKAHASVENLRNASQQAGTELQKKMDHANILIEDISFITERADKLYNEMESALKAPQKVPQKSPQKASQNRANLKTLPSDRQRMPERPEKSTSATPSVNENQKLQRQKALETILTEISNNREKTVTKKGASKPSSAAPNQGKDKRATKDEIANVLKAIGYGETT